MTNTTRVLAGFTAVTLCVYTLGFIAGYYSPNARHDRVTTTVSRGEAYNDGRNAGQVGLAPESNPWPESWPDLRAAWQRGWTDGTLERARARAKEVWPDDVPRR